MFSPRLIRHPSREDYHGPGPSGLILRRGTWRLRSGRRSPGPLSSPTVGGWRYTRLAREHKLQVNIPRCRCRHPPCLDHRGPPLFSQPHLWAQGRLQVGVSSISLLHGLLACHRGLFGFRPPVSILLPAGCPPVLDSPSVSHPRAQSYKYRLPLCLGARVPMPSALPYSWSIPFIPPVGLFVQRKSGPTA